MLHIEILGYRFRMNRGRDEARVAAVMVAIIMWPLLAFIAGGLNAAVATYAGPIATGGAMAVAFAVNFLLRAHATVPPQAYAAAIHAQDIQGAFMRELTNRLFKLAIYIAVLPLAIGLSTWVMAFGLVELLAFVLEWKVDDINPHHALVCFLVTWVGLCFVIVYLCWAFGTDRILSPKFWRPTDYPWIMTTAVTIVISAQREGAHWQWDMSTSDRWQWYLILSVLVAFRLTRTTAEVIRELGAFKSRLEPMPLDVLRNMDPDAFKALQEWVKARTVAPKAPT
jgi:hypothetical protein